MPQLNKRRVPFHQAPFADQAVGYEGIAFDEFLRRFVGRKDCHRALGWIAERSGSQENTASVKLI